MKKVIDSDNVRNASVKLAEQAEELRQMAEESKSKEHAEYYRVKAKLTQSAADFFDRITSGGVDVDENGKLMPWEKFQGVEDVLDKE